jgi:two-component system sensor histidine kinase MprB
VSRVSLRLRSVAAAAAAILLALGVAGVAVDVLVSRHLHRSLDATLRRRAISVAQLAAAAPAVLTTPGSLESPLGGTQLSVEVVDRRGRLVARSLSLGGRVLPVQSLTRRAISGDRSGYANVTSSGERLRAYTAPLAEVGGPAAGGAVVVAADEQDLQATLERLHRFVIGAGLAAAALGALAVGLLMGRALRPLRRLADAAAEIEQTGDAGRRLPEPGTRDEVAALASTLNAMLRSLEHARDAERRLLADASHELRTPLTALLGNVGYLARHGATPDLIAELEADAARLARLAEDLLAISREESAEPPSEHVRLDELARRVARGRVHAEAERPVSVVGDRVALERALTNLIGNAERYGPPGGRIDVAAEQHDGWARLTVADEGSGLTGEEAEAAFDRFWRGRHDSPGSGLGLAIVRATAERHGGRAYADGSRFTIELPALRDVSESGARTATVPKKGSP